MNGDIQPYSPPYERPEATERSIKRSS
ncbi:unnamed protein product, partial [Rotaria sp. Silwood1]